MLAVEDNKVSLDEPIKKYLPNFSIKYKDGKDYSNSITFRHLLMHRSGLAHEAPIGNNYVYGSFKEHIKSINETYLKFLPDEGYSYSNLGIDLVAYALSKIYNVSFEEYMQNKVFMPLDMNHSTYDQNNFLLNIKSATGHDNKTLAKYPISMIGAGGMYSSSDDMTHFIRCILNNGKHQGKKIINDEILQMMYDKPLENEWKYCLGVDVGLYKDKLLINHNGGGFGFLATQDIFPENGFGAAVLTNSVNHSNIHQQICRNIWSDIFDMQETKKEDCEPLKDVYRAFVGLYEASYNGGVWKLSVIPRNGNLYCNNQKLIYHSESLFFTQNNDCIEFDDHSMRYNNILLKKIN